MDGLAVDRDAALFATSRWRLYNAVRTGRDLDLPTAVRTRKRVHPRHRINNTEIASRERLGRVPIGCGFRG